jgi:hypothetical protein
MKESLPVLARAQAAERLLTYLMAQPPETTPDELLDEFVHDVCSEMASKINNEGFATQIRFLLDQGCSERDILDALTDTPKED